MSPYPVGGKVACQEVKGRVVLFQDKFVPQIVFYGYGTTLR